MSSRRFESAIVGRMTIRIIKLEAVPQTGTSKFGIPMGERACSSIGMTLRVAGFPPTKWTAEPVLAAAKTLARSERDKGQQ
jgi:hypothetical protein